LGNEAKNSIKSVGQKLGSASRRRRGREKDDYSTEIKRPVRGVRESRGGQFVEKGNRRGNSLPGGLKARQREDLESTKECPRPGSTIAKSGTGWSAK